MSQQSNIIPLEQCVFGNLGLHSVIVHLRSHPTFAHVPEHKLRGAAFGFLTAGASSDGDHDVPYQRCHRLYHDLNKSGQPKWREGLRDIYMQSVMDVLTILDRASGGVSFFLHTPATRPPGTNAVAQEVKMEAHLPKPLMAENPVVAIAVARMAQYFAENIGVHAMLRWDHANNTVTWPVNVNTQPGGAPYRAANQSLIPRGSVPRCVIYGRIPGEIEELIASFASAHLVVAPSSLIAPPQGATNPAPHLAPAGFPAVPTPGSATRRSHHTVSRPVTPEPKRRVGNDGVLGGREQVEMLSPKGKEHIRVAYSPGDPYTRDDLLALVEAHYDSDGDIIPSPRKSHGKQRARNDEDLSHVVAALQARIMELENIQCTQELEIAGLRRALTNSIAASMPPPVGTAGPAMGPAHTSTTEASARATAPGSPRGSARPNSGASSHGSFSAISSVSSLSASSAPVSPQQWARGAAGPATTRTTSTPSHAVGGRLGRYARGAVEASGLPLTTWDVLQTIADTYPRVEWLGRVQQEIFGCSAEIAKVLVKAMKKDLGL